MNAFFAICQDAGDHKKREFAYLGFRVVHSGQQTRLRQLCLELATSNDRNGASAPAPDSLRVTHPQRHLDPAHTPPFVTHQGPFFLYFLIIKGTVSK
jgi:hypothetical protein